MKKPLEALLAGQQINSTSREQAKKNYAAQFPQKLVPDFNLSVIFLLAISYDCTSREVASIDALTERPLFVQERDGRGCPANISI